MRLGSEVQEVLPTPRTSVGQVVNNQRWTTGSAGSRRSMATRRKTVLVRSPCGASVSLVEDTAADVVRSNPLTGAMNGPGSGSGGVVNPDPDSSVSTDWGSIPIAMR